MGDVTLYGFRGAYGLVGDPPYGFVYGLLGGAATMGIAAPDCHVGWFPHINVSVSVAAAEVGRVGGVFGLNAEYPGIGWG